jgi:glycosyltransferase involved in cell wall biosynthesis
MVRDAGASALGGDAFVCYRRHHSAQMRAAVSDAITELQPSVIYLDHLDSFGFADLATGRPTIIDLHNVYSTLVERAAAETDSIRRIYLRREARLLAQTEQVAVRACDLTFTVSQEDRRHFCAIGAKRTILVPNGVDCAAYSNLPQVDPMRPATLLFIGALSWPPNEVAVHFLVRELLPHVRRQVPDVVLQIVGRSPSPAVLRYRQLEGVTIANNVPDVRPYLAAAHLSVVPLTAGGGSRLKILEAFAAGVPVLSTPVGCEGLQVIPDIHLRIAELPLLADAAVELLRDRDKAEAMARSARTLAETYDWTAIAQRAAEEVMAVSSVA